MEPEKVKWGIDPVHSEIGFKVKHLMVTDVKGIFQQFGASIYTTGEDFMTSEIDFWMDPSSVNTGDAKRDEHLRSEDFFDVQHFKQISFAGNTYENVDHDGSYELYGDLTVKGITRQVKLDVEFGGVVKDQWGNEKAGISVNGKIDRKNWGLNWNVPLEADDMLVGDDVRISCVVQLVKQS